MPSIICALETCASLTTAPFNFRLIPAAVVQSWGEMVVG
jgi:hypothetical protein